MSRRSFAALHLLERVRDCFGMRARHDVYASSRFLRLDDLESFLEGAERAAADEDDDKDDAEDRLGEGALQILICPDQATTQSTCAALAFVCAVMTVHCKAILLSCVDEDAVTCRVAVLPWDYFSAAKTWLKHDSAFGRNAATCLQCVAYQAGDSFCCLHSNNSCLSSLSGFRLTGGSLL